MKIEAEILNASKNGISIECSEMLKEGTLYTIRLFWCGGVFDAKCEAVWSFSSGLGDKYRSGMKFIHVDNIDDFLTCVEVQAAETKRLHPGMKTTSAKALLTHP